MICFFKLFIVIKIFITRSIEKKKTMFIIIYIREPADVGCSEVLPYPKVTIT